MIQMKNKTTTSSFPKKKERMTKPWTPRRSVVPPIYGKQWARQPIAVSDISVYICLIDIRDGSCKPVYGGVDRLKALSSAKTGCRSRFFMN